MTMTHQTRTAEAALSDLQEDVAKAVARAVRRMSRLPAQERRALDPYGLLLRSRGKGARRLG